MSDQFPPSEFELHVRHRRMGTTAARQITMSISGLIAALLLAFLSVVPVPYAIVSAGPTYDVFAERDGQTLVSVSGTETYPPSGELRMTTVQVLRGSSERASLGPMLRGFFDGTQTVVPEEFYFDPPSNDEEPTSGVDDQAAQDWLTSQEIAGYAAASELGINVPATMRIAEIEADSLGNGVIEVDDQILSANGVTITYIEDLSALLEAMTPGDPITLTVDRAGEQLDLTFNTIADADGKARMGVWIDPIYDLPFEVDVAIDNVGGPSAGMMFTLAIIDLLTPEDELEGALVAGTGTIATDGDVGPIGGIDKKMAGARRDGADWFLAPVENCPDVVGHIPDGLRVVAVDTLHDAVVAMSAIGAGTGDALPTCPV